MNRNAADHAAHDELLLARFYGHDLGERERDEVADRIAGCPECAAFVDDLAAISSATRALPVPARPRDFTLTQANADRLRRRTTAVGLFGWLGRTRALGGSMAAVGLAGFVVVGVLSSISFGVASSATAPEAPNYGYGPVAANDVSAGPTAGPAQLSGVPGGGTGSVVDGDATPPPTLKGGPSFAPQPSLGAMTAAPSPASSPATAMLSPLTQSVPPIAAASPDATGGHADDSAASPSEGVRYSAGGKAAGVASDSPVVRESNDNGPVAGAPDGRVAVLAAFGLLFALGLLVLVAPLAFARVVRRRS